MEFYNQPKLENDPDNWVWVIVFAVWISIILNNC